MFREEESIFRMNRISMSITLHDESSDRSNTGNIISVCGMFLYLFSYLWGLIAPWVYISPQLKQTLRVGTKIEYISARQPIGNDIEIPLFAFNF